jgi:pantetheine-phosphate adenylyltransferase
MASERSHFISSRFVKEIQRLGGDVSQFVSQRVVEALKHSNGK